MRHFVINKFLEVKYEYYRKKIEELKEYENNPRHNDGAVDAVAESIRQFGFKVPIVIDTDGVIIAGHTRRKAALKLGLEVVPCIVADDLTPEQIKAFRLADNKTGELAGWDFARLEKELAEMSEIDMSAFGFEDQTEIDWSQIEEISKENYEKPETDKLRCPICGGVDEKMRFKKV